MQNSESFATLLFKTLKDEEANHSNQSDSSEEDSLIIRNSKNKRSEKDNSNKDPNLIHRALFHDFYREASRLLLYEYPTVMEIPQIIANRIRSPVLTNDGDFYSFILTAILRRYSLATQIFLIEDIPQQNLNYVLLPSIFEARNADDLNLFAFNSNVSKYFGDMDDFNPRKEFLSIKVLQYQFSQFLKEKLDTLKLKQNRPNKEFLFAGDRNSLKETSDKIIKIMNNLAKIACTQNKNFSSNKDADQSYDDVIDQLKSELSKVNETFSSVYERGQNHFLSMAAKEEAKLFLKDVEESAKFVNNFIQQAINSNSAEQIKEILKNIQSEILTTRTVRYQETFFLAELISLLYSKMSHLKSKKIDKILAIFGKAIISFEDNFKKNSHFANFYSLCVTYPTQRNEFLMSKGSETAQYLELFGKALKYIRYIEMSSIIESLMILERYCSCPFLLLNDKNSINQGECKTIIEEYEKRTDCRFINFIQINQIITNILKNFRGFPFVNLPSEDFVFDDKFPRYEFNGNLKLNNSSLSDIETIYSQKFDLNEALPPANLYIKTCVKCQHCKELQATRICEKCQKFTSCLKCLSQGCPICGKPFPNGK
ncbi:hypothetical protein TRFO_15733 [Tritrichomonas foetus]|uniref:Uncharacterized protein n=1 Tax=Tritrichomonas foetus TaxID=1144522 RepID=A0A1J4KW34_9EUKA|nr:hypothetical protein TRFO_15733 [Tritrichomonas foetus]|eukprot:OHT13964.1 hypothetical protein TRFO_15733 [Tritrichomonas foetus]